MDVHELTVLLTALGTLVLMALQAVRWWRDRDVEQRDDYEAHTSAAVKADSIALETILKVLAAVTAENRTLRENNAQLAAENAAFRARQENSP